MSDLEEESVVVIETEEIGEDGTVHKITKTITTKYVEDNGDGVPVHSVRIRTSSTGSSASSSSSTDGEVKQLTCECITPSGEHSTPVISDNHDGTYTVDINASEPGVHTIDVELNGEKIPGSPYMVRIVQAADKKKVHFYGKGTQSGILDHFDGLFYVDTKGAGPGDLKVKVHGPKGGFDVALRKNDASDRVVNVEYEPSMEGVYTIHVLWSGEHVEGSPRRILLTNDEEQLSDWREHNERKNSVSSGSDE